MSIFINGMQLPKDEVAVIIYSDGDVRTEDWTKYSAIEVPDETQPVKWISVTERLPEAHEAVVVFHPKYSNIHIAAYYRELETQPEVHCVNKWYVYGGFGVVLNPEPTHWMPLPEPPKDGET